MIEEYKTLAIESSSESGSPVVFLRLLAINIIELRGSGTVYVEIEIGSRYDIRRDDGLNEKLKFDFSFRLRLDHLDKKILSSYYKIDTSWYYE